MVSNFLKVVIRDSNRKIHQ